MAATAMTDTGKGFTITVLFFASAREAAGGITKVELQVNAATDTAALRRILAEQYPNLATTVLDEDSLTLALNEEYVAAGQVIALKCGDTVALIPPISGG